MLHDEMGKVAQWVKFYLSDAHARGMQDLLACSQYSSREVLSALQQLIEQSEIEALEPVGAKNSASNRCAFHPETHFRLRRESDNAYRWQVRMSEKIMSSNDWARHADIQYHPDAQYRECDWFRMRLPVRA